MSEYIFDLMCGGVQCKNSDIVSIPGVKKLIQRESY